MVRKRDTTEHLPAKDLLVGKNGKVIGKDNEGPKVMFIQEKSSGRRGGHLRDQFLMTDLLCFLKIVFADDRIAADEIYHEKAKTDHWDSDDQAKKNRIDISKVTDECVRDEYEEEYKKNGEEERGNGHGLSLLFLFRRGRPVFEKCFCITFGKLVRFFVHFRFFLHARLWTIGDMLS